MKKKIIALLVLGMIMINTTFANDINKNVNNKVLAAFENKFGKASKVNWIKTDDYYKVSFQLNAQHLTAFFSEEGESMGVSRNLLKSELPINLQIMLNKDYSTFWVTDLFEYASDGESTYYLTIQDTDKEIILKSAATTDWFVFKKNKVF